MSIFTTMFGSRSSENNNIQVLDILEFKLQTQNKNVQLIDVRTPKEYNLGHIQNAVNIGLSESNFVQEFNKLNKVEPVYIYCRSGARSRQCSIKLAEMGFTNIYDLKGGILNYK